MPPFAAVFRPGSIPADSVRIHRTPLDRGQRHTNWCRFQILNGTKRRQDAKFGYFTPTAVGVYHFLLDHLDATTGRCDPTIETIASHINRSDEAVRLATAELETAGLIGHTMRKQAIPGWRFGGRQAYRQTSNQYWFAVISLAVQQPKLAQSLLYLNPPESVPAARTESPVLERLDMQMSGVPPPLERQRTVAEQLAILSQVKVRPAGKPVAPARSVSEQIAAVGNAPVDLLAARRRQFGQ